MTLYIILGVIGVFIIQALRNDPATKGEDKKSPMYGFERDTTTTDIKPIVWLLKDEGEPVADPVKAVKENLYAHDFFWFANNPEYMVKDDDFIDPLIQEAINEINDGKLPKNTGGVKELSDEVIMLYRNKINKEEGLQRTEQLIQNRYNNPIMTTNHYQKYYNKTVDMGVLPTKLRTQIRGGITQVRSSGVVDDYGRWESKEVARQIKKLTEDGPNLVKFIVRTSLYTANPVTDIRYVYSAKLPDSPLPPLLNIEPNNNYEARKSRAFYQTHYLFHPIEEYINGKYSIYEYNDYNYKTSPEWKAMNQQ